MSVRWQLAFLVFSIFWTWAVIRYFAEHGWLMPSEPPPFRAGAVTTGYIDGTTLHLGTCEMDGIVFYPRKDGACYAADAHR